MRSEECLVKAPDLKLKSQGKSLTLQKDSANKLICQDLN